MAIPQIGLLNDTQGVKTLAKKIKDGIDESYVIQMPFLKYFYDKGRVEDMDGYVYERQIDVAPSANAGARDINDRLPGDLRKIGGTDTRFDLGIAIKKTYLSHFYCGLRRTGLFTEAAKVDKGNGRAFLQKQIDRCMEQLKFQEELAFIGDGSMAMAVVSTATGRRVTVKAAAGTVATAGYYGLTLMRFPNRSIVFVDPSSGSVLTDGNGKSGYKVVSYDKANNVAILDRNAPTALASGHIIVEGDDEANSYGKGFPGVDAYVGTAADRLSIDGLNRAIPGNEYLNALSYDLEVSGELGQLRAAQVEQAMIEVNFANGGRVDTLIHHPLAQLELKYGFQIEGSKDEAVHRSLDGFMAQRRFMQPGELNIGFTSVRVSTGPYGTVDLLPMWNCKPNKMYGLTSGDVEIKQRKGGVTPLGGGAGDDGMALRVPFYDTFDWAWRRSVTAFFNTPNKHFVLRNVMHQSPTATAI